MSQPMRVRRQLQEVCAIDKPVQPRLVDGMPWHSAASHSDVNNFRQRQIARGMQIKERK